MVAFWLFKLIIEAPLVKTGPEENQALVLENGTAHLDLDLFTVHILYKESVIPEILLKLKYDLIQINIKHYIWFIKLYKYYKLSSRMKDIFFSNIYLHDMLINAYQDMTLSHMTLQSFPVLCNGVEY